MQTGQLMKSSDEDSKPSLEGIDVSRYQGVIDWEKVAKAGIRFAIVKASEGETYRDLYLDRNIAECNKHSILVGAYHFFRGSYGAVQQAEHFYEVCKGKTFQLPPVMDFELLPETTEQACRFLGATTAYWETTPLVYSYPSFIGSLKRDQWLGELVKFPLWIAHYNNNPGHPMATPPWQDWVIHQYTDKGKVDGIAGPVDRNLFLGTEEELEGLRINKLPLVPITTRIEGVIG